MERIFRKIQIILITLAFLYVIYTLAHIDRFLKSPTLNNYLNSLLNSNFVIGLYEYLNDRSHSWEILTTIATTVIAVLSLFFLFRRLRKQDKLIKETVLSNTANRFRDALNLLQTENDSVIIGAIFLLDRLAREQPKVYAKLVIEIWCSYIRNESIKRLDTEKSLPLKLQTIIDCLFRKGKVFRDFVYTDNYNIINLKGSNLSFANFSKADLSDVDFIETNLSYADFSKACLSRSKFIDAKLTGANFDAASLTYSKFVKTNMNKVRNLNESRRLESVKFDSGKPEFVQKILDDDYKYTLEKMHPFNFLDKLFKKRKKNPLLNKGCNQQEVIKKGLVQK